MIRSVSRSNFRNFIFYLCYLSVIVCLGSCAMFGPPKKMKLIQWEEEWSKEIFSEAKSKNLLVILDLEAQWCHWCHVMAQQTYLNEEVTKLIGENFIAVRIDQDSRPELANRYRQYGWPATIIFNSEGKELIKRRGYIEADEMVKLLGQAIENPNVVIEDSPKVNYANEPLLPPELQEELYHRHLESYDYDTGGLKIAKKFIDADSMEYAIFRAFSKDYENDRMARQTLDAGIALVDSVWGGMFQYSTKFTWTNPHYEKIMSTQSNGIRIYTYASKILNEPKYLRVARDIERYLRFYLTSPEGAFYTSQNADLIKGQESDEYFFLENEERKAKGIPEVDKSIYSRENGWAIESITSLYTTTGKNRYLKKAEKAALWIIANRSLKEGGFSHGEEDIVGPYLGDTLAMGRAFLALYQASAKYEWLEKAEAAALFIQSNFQNSEGAGFFTVASSENLVFAPTLVIDENIQMARFSNMLFRLTQNPDYRTIAEHAMRYLATPAIAKKRLTEAGILLANYELSYEPLHVTVVGKKDDPRAKEMFLAAWAHGSVYKIVEWWDESEGQPSLSQVEFPRLDKAAAFVCANQSCSLPAFTVEDLRLLLDKQKLAD